MDVTVDVQYPLDKLYQMSDRVNIAISNSLKALFESDINTANNVIHNDKVINSLEIDIDTSTYDILSISKLQSDILREVLSIQKISVILERIGDHAVNIAESAINLINEGRENRDFYSLIEMSLACKEMFNDALKSFFNKNLMLAKDILPRDNRVDELNMETTGLIKTKLLCGDTGDLSIERAMELIRVSKNLERIADLSTNIAEEACFMISGKISKHHNMEKVSILKGEE